MAFKVDWGCKHQTAGGQLGSDQGLQPYRPLNTTGSDVKQSSGEEEHLEEDLHSLGVESLE